MKGKAYLDITLIVVMLVLAGSYIYNRGGQPTTNASSEAVLRVATIDLLTGSALPQSIDLVTPVGESVALQPAGPGVLWLLDPDNCIGCLIDLKGWNGYAGDDVVRSAVIVTGLFPDEASRRLIQQAGLRGAVYFDPQDALREQLGIQLPSTFVAHDATGIIRMVDSRKNQGVCTWSFPEQVRALHLGTN